VFFNNLLVGARGSLVMKRRSVLKKQLIEKEKKRRLEGFLRVFRTVGSWVLKGSLLMVALLGISLLLISLYGYLLKSPYIKLGEVVITGADEQLKSQLVEMAKLDFEASLLAINLKEVKDALEKHPWIRSVDLEKHFPHTLMIRVEKEDPKAIVAMDRLYYVNSSSEVFKALDPGDETDFPVITGVTGKEEDKQKLLCMALQVLKALENQKEPWSAKNLSEVHVRKDGDAILYFSHFPGGVKIRGSDLAARVDDLKKVVEHLNGVGRIHMVRTIDLNYNEGAAVSFKKG
jgi:cell division protein FtsQ